MQTGRVDQDTLRRLAEYESRGEPVLSFYVDLDPSEFALGHARATAIRSLVDDAHRRIEGHEQLGHDERKRGLEAVEQVRDWFEGPRFSAEGAHGLGVFCAAGDGLFEVVKLPRPVPSEVVIGRKPFVEPLVDMASGGGWCVLLASREAARVFRGSVHRLDEVAYFGKELPRGQHDQGGWSQPRYERSIEEDVDDHVKGTTDLLYRRFKRAPFDHLILGATRELAPLIEDRLHPDMRSRCVGRIDIDAEHSSPEQVLQVAQPLMEEHEARAEEEALGRLRERLQDGRAASGLEDVLEALSERRVETLLLDEGFSATAAMCPHCGWLGPEQVESCPADGTSMERREDVVQLAIERALGQSAEVRMPKRSDEVSQRGGIAAILRF
ncbi:MAG TPA: Vms1/Ankzf1 family peptidyl-tRNA hydrolase [Thermoleophilaceae bacterium]|nr:Vms1/Ankzf1 family peptidyl-tRNA hydrolase [Thermoleophilaceae bacterium]